MKTVFLYIFAYVLMTCPPIFADESATSIFDEGVDREITRSDMTPELIEWAKNTSVKLTKVLASFNILNPKEKRTLLIHKIQESVDEAANTRELLLMRYALNRALDLNTLFSDEEDDLALTYVLLPIVKEAITLYLQTDLPYIVNNINVAPKGEMESPSYAQFTKAEISYLLTVSNMHKMPEGQFNILIKSLVWTFHDIKRSPAVRENAVNANLMSDIKDLYFLYKDLRPEELTFTILNRIRALLLKARNEIVTEKGKSINAFMAYAPQKPSILFHPLVASPVTPPTPPSPARIIPRDYADERYHSVRAGVGWGKINEDPVTHTSLAVIEYDDPTFGNAGYVVKTDFDSTDLGLSPVAVTRNFKVLGGRCLFPVFNSDMNGSDSLYIGPFLNVYDYRSNAITKLRYVEWFNTGLALHIQPTPSKQFFIDVNAYWSLGTGDTEGSVEVHDFSKEDASSEWQVQYAKNAQVHYDQETAQIQASQAKADELIKLGYQKYVSKSDGHEYIRTSGNDDKFNFRILNSGDRSPLTDPDKDGDRSVQTFTAETSCTLIRSIRNQDDLILECGGYMRSPKLERFDGNYPSLYRSEFQDRLKNWGTHASLQYRLWNKNSEFYSTPYPDSKQTAKHFNDGPVLHISYQVDEDGVARDIIHFFNPELAKESITKTKTLHIYFEFHF